MHGAIERDNSCGMEKYSCYWYPPDTMFNSKLTHKKKIVCEEAAKKIGWKINNKRRNLQFQPKYKGPLQDSLSFQS
jgi:hypothetical protein